MNNVYRQHFVLYKDEITNIGARTTIVAIGITVDSFLLSTSSSTYRVTIDLLIVSKVAAVCCRSMQFLPTILIVTELDVFLQYVSFFGNYEQQ